MLAASQSCASARVRCVILSMCSEGEAFCVFIVLRQSHLLILTVKVKPSLCMSAFIELTDITITEKSGGSETLYHTNAKDT